VLRTHVRHEARHLDQLRGRLERGARDAVGRRRRALEAVAGQLDSLSPLACLARGYSICTLPSGQVVTRADQASPGDGVAVRLREGTLECRVEETRDG
jgi:exodeoxyribonuclease VII large subunit